MHTTRKKADWQYRRKDNLTRWQSIAMTTHGAITPGNIISVIGLVLVIIGSYEIYNAHILIGLYFILSGRLMDLIDGVVAEYTKTKSHIGEIVDTTSDKFGIIFAALAAYSGGLFATPLFVILFLHHTFTALFSILYARRYNVHTTKLGKYAMFTSWATIILAIYASSSTHVFFSVLTTIATAGYGLLAICACISYYFALQRKIVLRMRSASWTNKVGTIIYVGNKKASNIKRADRWMTRIAKGLNKPRIDLSIKQASTKLIDTIKQETAQGKSVLLAVAGGDGTASAVANIILNSNDKTLLQNTYFVPLWGGNANDFATMLNGLSSQANVHYLLARSSVVGIPTIKVTLSEKEGQTRTLYACGYASFGASAYAARQINQSRLADNSLVRYFPPLFVLRELWEVFRALLEAPQFLMSHGDQDSEHYEHTFINGSRIAKVNRVPISLAEPAFFHAAVDKKHASYIIEIIRILFKRTRKQYVKRHTISFTLKGPVDAQIDGEVYAIASGTKVTISTAKNLLNCVSTKFDN